MIGGSRRRQWPKSEDALEWVGCLVLSPFACAPIGKVALAALRDTARTLVAAISLRNCDASHDM